MLVIILSTIGPGLAVTTLIAVDRRLIKQTTADALFAVANLLTGIGCILTDNPFWACVCAAVVAWCAYDWWHKGGGDGTRRRLRAWASRFHGVRRTAPAGAS